MLTPDKNLFLSTVLIWWIVLILGSGCTFYRTITLEPTTDKIDSLIKIKSAVTICDSTEVQEYLWQSISIENDTILGIIAAASDGKRHDLHDDFFRAGLEKVYQPKTTLHIFSALSSISPGLVKIPIGLLSSMEVHKTAVGGSIVASFFVVVGVAAVVGGVVLLIACNCPHVLTYDGSNFVSHGTLFPGAILMSLKRTDYVILDAQDMTPNDTLTIRIANEQPEEHFIDKLSVLEVSHTGYPELGISQSGHLVAWNELNSSPLKYAYSCSQDITRHINTLDGTVYDFQNNCDEEALTSAVLSFDRPLADSALLVLNAKQAHWLDTVGQYVFYMGGKANSKWISRKENTNATKWRAGIARQGLSMNVYLFYDGKWQYTGTFHDAGTSAFRNISMSIDISEIEDSDILVKLECAFRIWEVDKVGLMTNWNSSPDNTRLEFVSCTQQDGISIIDEIAKVDGIYHKHSARGEYSELVVVPSADDRTIVLEGCGYYHHLTHYTHKPDLGFFMALRKPLGLHDLSRSLHYQLMESRDAYTSNQD